MTDLLAHNPARHRPSILTIIALVVGLGIAAALDLPVRHWVLAHVHNSEQLDAMKMFRSGGYLPTWLFVAAAILFVDRARIGRWGWPAARRATVLVATVIVGGIANEVVKLLARRLRPDQSDGHWYVFRSFAQKTFGSGGLSMPSSHAAVAFSAAFALANLFPPAGCVFIAFAIGTGVSRLMADAHYLSDIYVAALLGMAAAQVTRWAVERLERPATTLLDPA